MELLERRPYLDQLAAWSLESRSGRGRLALVAGDAGIGKTSLVETFCLERAEGTQVLWGSCDAVVPARPFAPLADIAGEVGGPLRAALDSAARDRVFEAFLGLLRERGAARIVVFDDLHWADEATLDLLRVVGPRLRELPVLLVGTYRDDEIGPSHPLRLALGDLPSRLVSEVRLPPLSADAVKALAAGSGMDPEALHGVTSGNPFFVTEVLAGGVADVPAAVSDAVLARVARLPPSARLALQAASVLGVRFDRALLMEVAGRDAAAVEECVARGMLEPEGEVLRFRHELAQRAVRDALGSAERVTVHGRVLAALRRAGTADPAQLTHHAVEAGDRAAAVEFAPAAAAWAADLGAHREAAAHYAAALRFVEGADDQSRAVVLEGHARECLAIDEVETALASQEAALECRRRLGDVRAEANCLRSLSDMLWFSGDGDRAIAVAERAVELLEPLAAGDVELARAYATVAQRHFNAGGEDAVALAWAERALALAEQLGDESTAVHAMTTVASTEIFLGIESGWAKLEESLRRAKAAGLKADASRAVINLVESARDTRRYDLVDRYRAEAVAHLADHDPDHDLYRRRLRSDLAELALERGRWQEADDLAVGLLGDGRSAPLIRVKALVVLGRLRARRGRSEPWSLLDEGLAIANVRGEDMVPLYAARAEAAWLEGDATRARGEAEAGLRLASELAVDAWRLGDLTLWAWKAGCRQLPAGSAEPYALHVASRYAEAASAWEAIGSPYQQALALADSGAEDDLRRALRIFHSLSARPMAHAVAGRLRALGARNIPRGPRPATRSNDAGLTPRELEVLALLGRSMRNVDIAERLVVSTKTVDHHVSAILRKLGVPNRAAAVEKAAQLDLEDGEIVGPK